MIQSPEVFDALIYVCNNYSNRGVTVPQPPDILTICICNRRLPTCPSHSCHNRHFFMCICCILFIMFSNLQMLH